MIAKLVSHNGYLFSNRSGGGILLSFIQSIEVIVNGITHGFRYVNDFRKVFVGINVILVFA